MTSHNTPVLRRADVVVVEGTVGGCALAWYLAKRGLAAALVCSGSSPAYEVASCLRPFAHGDEIDAMPAEFARIFDEAMIREAFETSFFHVGVVTDGIEDLLLDAGVSLYYTAHPLGALFAGDTLAGVAVGGKAGVQALLAPVVVDCSPWATVARSTGASFRPRLESGEITATYSILCKDDLPAMEHYEVPGDVARGLEVVTRGYYAELVKRAELETADPLAPSRLAAGIRQDLVAIGRWERRSLPRLDIVRGADALLPSPLWRLVSRATAPTERTAAAAGTTALPAAAFASRDVDNLYVLGQCADLPDRQAAAMHRSYHRAIYQAAALAGAIDPAAPRTAADRYELRVTGPDSAPRGGAASGRRFPSDTLRIADPGFDEPGESVPVLIPDLPVAAESDLLVVGAGSSGSPAAAAAAARGCRVTLLDKHGDVGGTHTIGGVATPWFGYRPPWFVSLQKRLRATKRAATVPQTLAMSEWLVESGVSVLPAVAVTGVYTDGSTMDAVLGVGDLGPVVVAAKSMIDATGDGDLCAWAGAPYSYGTERDRASQWYSFGKFTDRRPGVSRKYRSIVDVRSLSDISRAMVIGRRQLGMHGEGEFPQYYLTPRESRHIRGAARLTFLDGLAERRFEETVAVHHSNFDIKGVASSDLVMAGFIDREAYRCYDAYVPFGTMLPEGLANVLVTGKAYDASHDVLALARQIADVMCQGAAAGIAAAMALERETNPREIDVRDLQRELIQAGLIVKSDCEPRPLDVPRSLELFVGTGDFKHLGRIALAGKEAVPQILSRLESTTGDIRRHLSRLLCWLGDASANDFLLSDLAAELAKEPLPREVGHLSNAPNHGYQPEASYDINALAMTCETRLVPLLSTIPPRINLPLDATDAQFCYVYSVAYAAERLADPALAPTLEALLDNPAIRDRALPAGSDPRLTVDWVADRYAYLELVLARALARCGARRGYELLVSYLGDIRAFLRGSAREELSVLAGVNLAYDACRWSQWLCAHEGCLGAMPLARRFD